MGPFPAAQIPLGHLPAALPFSLSVGCPPHLRTGTHAVLNPEQRGRGRDVRRLTSSAHQLVGDRGCVPRCVCGGASPSGDPHFFLGFPSPQLWVLSCPQLSRDVLSSSHVSNFEFLVGFDWSLKGLFSPPRKKTRSF